MVGIDRGQWTAGKYQFFFVVVVRMSGDLHLPRYFGTDINYESLHYAD